MKRMAVRNERLLVHGRVGDLGPVLEELLRALLELPS